MILIFSAYSSEIVKRTKEAFSNVNSKTVWETYNKQRVTQSLEPSTFEKDYTINRVYIKPYTTSTESTIKRDQVPSPLPSSTRSKRKIIQIHLTGSTKIPQSLNDQDKSQKNLQISLSHTNDKSTISRESNWHLKYKKPQIDLTYKDTNCVSTKHDVDIATKIARNLRLKELKKQIERENEAAATAPCEKKQDPKPIEKEKSFGVTVPKSAVTNTTPSKQKQDSSTVISSTKLTINNKSLVTAPFKPSLPIAGKLEVAGSIITNTAKLSKKSTAKAMQSIQNQDSKKKSEQPNLITKTVTQAKAFGIFPTQSMVSKFPLTSLQPQGLGFPSQGLIPIHAQAMMPFQTHANWQPISPNMSALGIPANIVGVPEMLRMQAEFFSSSSPITNQLESASNSFNPDDFEPPNFDCCTNPVEAKSSKIRDVLTPPPGVDMEEYLKEHSK